MTHLKDYESHSEEDCAATRCSLVVTIQHMKERESAYKVSDYLHQPELLSCQEPVDISCRAQMIDWMKNIIDHCKFNRSTISIAVNCMDRFLMTTEWVLRDRSAFQLASITSLYVAIKICEPTVLSVKSIVTLTRNAYKADQIEAMERLILESIKWLVNPSTAMTFAPYLCELAATFDPRLDLGTLQELTMLQLENTLTDYEMGLIPASAVALAAVINAVDSMAVSSIEQQQAMEWEFRSFMSLDDDIRIHDVQVRLYEGVLAAENQPGDSPEKLTRSCGFTSHYIHSPRAVSNLRVLL
jgi:hypothetical protein